MLRRIVISLCIVALVLSLLAGFGHYWLGWWRSSHDAIVQTDGGYNAASEAASLPEVLALAHDALDQFGRDIHDYSSVIVKTERIGSQPITTVLFAKIRENPFSVYLYFLDRSDDKSVKGREVIFVQGQNDNKLVGHSPGLLTGSIKLSLPPKGIIAMLGERYPITELGLANLCRQLIKRGEAAGDPSQVLVKRIPQARINKRPCTLLEVMYPVHEPRIWGYLARVFVDNERRFPIRVEVFELPADRGKIPELVEEYTYLDLKTNNGYTDLDFDPKNRQYRFP